MDGGPPPPLETQYLYQNAATGNPSNAPLTTSVICRMLNSEAMTLITRDTLVIPFDPVSRTYGSQGWLPIKDVPVLNVAGSKWYYTLDSDVSGPVSCKDLVGKMKDLDANSVKVFNASLSDSDVGKNEWKLVKDVIGFDTVINIFSAKIEGSQEDRLDHVQSVDNSDMVYDDEGENSSDVVVDKDDRAAELNAFLASTSGSRLDQNDENDHEEAYHSDGGTEYIKCESTGQWIEADLMRSRREAAGKSKSQGKAPAMINTNRNSTNLQDGTKKRKKTANFSAKKAKNWIYVTGLPSDTNVSNCVNILLLVLQLFCLFYNLRQEVEVADFFARAGIIDLDPESQLPKVKLYRHKKHIESGNRVGDLKGDASICYARPESVDLAIQILDESMFRVNSSLPIHVSKAKFEQKGDAFQKNSVSLAKRKVAKLAAAQAVDWDEGDNGRLTGGKKGLRIIVLKGMFRPKDVKTDVALHELENKILGECSKYGDVEKITVFTKNEAGIVVVKFTQPAAASASIKAYHNIFIGGKRIEATFWDGVTDFTVRDEDKEAKEAEKRHEEFGEWLDQQQLPEHLKLRVEGDS